MTVWQGTASLNGTGNLSALARRRAIITTSFAGAGSLNATARARAIIRPEAFSGAGSLSCRPQIPSFITARFAGAGSLSALDTILQVQVQIVCQSFLQAVVTNPLATLVGDPKKRLVLAVQIDILPLE
jgi:hypothetical protein